MSLTTFIRRAKARFLILFRWLTRTRGVWLRAALCWGIGLSFVFVDQTTHFDRRFEIRGEQSVSDSIVLVLISENEWAEIHGQRGNLLRPLREFTNISDSFFWSPRTWEKLLKAILEDSPEAIGVTYFFGPNVSQFRSRRRNTKAFQNTRVKWASELDNDGQVIYPAFAQESVNNTGLVSFRQDEDRVVRRFTGIANQAVHMALRLVPNDSLNFDEHELALLSGESRLINFRGRPNRFPSVSAEDVLSGNVPTNYFHDKIVIIGSRDSDGHTYRTPLGEMTRAELVATVTDNYIGERWVDRLPRPATALYLLAILIVSIYVMSSYPQSVAFVFLFWLGTGLTAVSLWTFDTFYFWTPILAPLAQLATTYIVFLGFQLTIKENLSWRLEQEKKYLTEVEQLKNNFVSLISHDLKTPIAKIQAICDRLMAQSKDEELNNSLTALRNESSELHRYIQSIIRISRVESRAVKINKEASDLNEIAETVVAQLQPLASDKGICIELDLEPMFSIEFDTILIQEVLLNLVENAIKYSPEGGQVTIATREADDRAYVTVSDTGDGIPLEDQKRIFEKFYRGKEQAMKTKGTGLGLFLVKYFVELHGGEVFLRSQVGQGTQVGFYLPVSETEENDEFTDFPGESA